MIKERFSMKCYVALFICLMSLTLGAQQPAAPPKPTSPAKPAVPPTPVPVLPQQPDEGGQPTNIRLDVAVIDATAQGAAQPKSVMVMLVDRALGQARAAFEDRTISMDARPTLVDGRVRVFLTIVSEPFRANVSEPRDPTVNWRNSFSLLLENGKPMVALETMDAVTKRKLSIEVKATVQK
jgi:hypothetical protein